MRNPTQQTRAAFTLVEIMIVVAILALITTIAVPSWLRARMRAHNAKFINDVRVHSHAVDNYATDNKTYPPDYPPGALDPTPAGMVPFKEYVDDEGKWAQPTPIGGSWDLQGGTGPIVSAVGATGYTVDLIQMELLDELGDNDDPNSGPMRIDGPGYYYVIEEI